LVLHDKFICYFKKKENATSPFPAFDFNLISISPFSFWLFFYFARAAVKTKQTNTINSTNAQFLFLYSYHPSGGMGDLPKRLEAAWQERHRENAEEVFAKVIILRHTCDPSIVDFR